MSASIEQTSSPPADTAASAAPSSLPLRKRKAEDLQVSDPSSKVPRTDDVSPSESSEVKDLLKKLERPPMSKGREVRLEQNRKAARESRRRKKVMIEELQRSVIFFSRANGTLKQRNEELTRLLMQCKMNVAAMGGDASKAPAPASSDTATLKAIDNEAKEQAQANTVATQAVLESQGFPAAAARAAAQTISVGAMTSAPSAPAPLPASLSTLATPTMQPGATMQAMANFQQAATVAMQSAMGQMQDIPGVSMSQLSAAPAGTNAQQVYTDTMTALAMQQAAAAAAVASQQFALSSGIQNIQPLLNQWQQDDKAKGATEKSNASTNASS